MGRTAVFDLVAFYATIAGLSFTLLGLWWVVADRRKQWFVNPHHRRMAYVVSLHFMLPGAMGVLSLVDPAGSFFWRLVFTLSGVAGIVGAVMVSSAVRSEFGYRRLAAGMLWVALPVYALVVAVALAPDLADLVDMAPRQLEGIFISLVLLLGINAAWFLSTTPDPVPEPPIAPPTSAV
jgi:hypothetical protein